MNFIMTIAASALIAVTGTASAAPAPNIGVNICTTHSYVNFTPSGDTTKEQLIAFVAKAGCYTPPTKDATFGALASGAAIEKVGTSSRLVRLLDADGKTVGHASYAFTLIPMATASN